MTRIYCPKYNSYGDDYLLCKDCPEIYTCKPDQEYDGCLIPIDIPYVKIGIVTAIVVLSFFIGRSVATSHWQEKFEQVTNVPELICDHSFEQTIINTHRSFKEYKDYGLYGYDELVNEDYDG